MRERIKGIAVFCALFLTLAAGVPGAAPGREKRMAEDILRKAGVQGGLIVHLDCDRGRLTAALRANDRFVVHGLDSKAAEVEKAREYVKSQGLYGSVSVEHWDCEHLPYTDNLVNLVIAEEPLPVPQSEIMRVLAPSGVACVRRDGQWQKTVKPWPDEIDEWTHYLHGPDKNAVARDTQVKPPRHFQWKNEPMWCRSHDGVPSSIAAMVSANGRMFCIVDEGIIGQPKLPQHWTLVARDAFNGKLLWKKPVNHRNAWCVAAVGDRVYVTLGNNSPVSILDGATGEVLHTCEGTDNTKDLVCTSDTLVTYSQNAKLKRRSGKGKGEAVVALDRMTGRPRWIKEVEGMHGHNLAAANGRVCYHNGKQVVCRDLKDGEVIWQADCNRGQTLIIYKGAVLFTASNGLHSFSLDSGKLLWRDKHVRGRDLFGADGLVWPRVRTQGPGSKFHWRPRVAKATGYDPLSGDLERTISVDRYITPGHHFRCYRPKATERYLLSTKRGVEFLDLRGDGHMRHNWLRAPCVHGFVPCNGLLYMPPHQCFCYPGTLLNGFNVLAGAVEGPDRQKPTKRLVRGPAWGTKVGSPSSADEGDWPIYRHDPQRSGCTDSEVPARLETLWQTDFVGETSPPVADDGRLYVARTDAHTVCCLNAENGQEQWSYTAGGRVDSPPTVYGNLVLFGCADGHVYCVRSRDGKLVWRFRAAPEDRRIMAFGQLESAWPVHGSVLVQDGTVYFTAGRSSYLDGGMYVYGLDPETGEVLHENHLNRERPEIGREAGRPFDMEGTKTDILVSDGEDLYLFHTRLNPDLTLQSTPRITKLGDRKVSQHLMCNDGFMEKTWFDRSYWTYGNRWPGYYFAYDSPKSGQILVFDEDTVYGLHVFRHRRGHSPMFKPGDEGYELFADDKACDAVLRPMEIGREKGTSYTRSRLPRWSSFIPVRAKAMVLAGERLFLCGPPDVVPNDDPEAAFKGRKGSRLWVVSANNGRRLAEYKLESMPAFDGMIAADGRLYMVSEDGSLMCMGNE